MRARDSRHAHASVNWPVIPRAIHGMGGPITVRLVKRPRGDDRQEAWGTWEPATRTIRLERQAPIAHRWRVFWHEWQHAVLDDAGLCHLMTDEAQETLCDACASAMIAKMRGELAAE